jgi:hypothetical protein
MFRLSPADSKLVKQTASSGQFCLYMWRSLEAPGVSYLPTSVDSAHTVYCEMLAEGYIVKAVELGTGKEYEMRDGTLVPVLASGRSRGSGLPALA